MGESSLHAPKKRVGTLRLKRYSRNEPLDMESLRREFAPDLPSVSTPQSEPSTAGSTPSEVTPSETAHTGSAGKLRLRVTSQKTSPRLRAVPTPSKQKVHVRRTSVLTLEHSPPKPEQSQPRVSDETGFATKVTTEAAERIAQQEPEQEDVLNSLQTFASGVISELLRVEQEHGEALDPSLRQLLARMVKQAHQVDELCAKAIAEVDKRCDIDSLLDIEGTAWLFQGAKLLRDLRGRHHELRAKRHHAQHFAKRHALRPRARDQVGMRRSFGCASSDDCALALFCNLPVPTSSDKCLDTLHERQCAWETSAEAVAYRARVSALYQREEPKCDGTSWMMPRVLSHFPLPSKIAQSPFQLHIHFEDEKPFVVAASMKSTVESVQTEVLRQLHLAVSDDWVLRCLDKREYCLPKDVISEVSFVRELLRDDKEVHMRLVQRPTVAQCAEAGRVDNNQSAYCCKVPSEAPAPLTVGDAPAFDPRSGVEWQQLKYLPMRAFYDTPYRVKILGLHGVSLQSMPLLKNTDFANLDKTDSGVQEASFTPKQTPVLLLNDITWNGHLSSGIFGVGGVGVTAESESQDSPVKLEVRTFLFHGYSVLPHSRCATKQAPVAKYVEFGEWLGPEVASTERSNASRQLESAQKSTARSKKSKKHTTGLTVSSEWMATMSKKQRKMFTKELKKIAKTQSEMPVHPLPEDADSPLESPRSAADQLRSISSQSTSVSSSSASASASSSSAFSFSSLRRTRTDDVSMSTSPAALKSDLKLTLGSLPRETRVAFLVYRVSPTQRRLVAYSVQNLVDEFGVVKSGMHAITLWPVTRKNTPGNELLSDANDYSSETNDSLGDLDWLLRAAPVEYRVDLARVLRLAQRGVGVGDQAVTAAPHAADEQESSHPSSPDGDFSFFPDAQADEKAGATHAKPTSGGVPSAKCTLLVRWDTHALPIRTPVVDPCDREPDASVVGVQLLDNQMSTKDRRRLQEIMSGIGDQSVLTPLDPETKRLLWQCRSRLRNSFHLLPLLLRATDWSSLEHRLEVHRLLRQWAPPEAPIDALELLDGRYADYAVRAYAVGILRTLNDDELRLLLLQLVQALKFESYHDSPLARFLLQRALASPRFIGHELYWMLRAEMTLPNQVAHAERYGALVEEYLHHVPAIHLQELRRQSDTMRALQTVAEKVCQWRKEGMPTDKTKENYRAELRLLNARMSKNLASGSAHPSVQGIQLPLDPRVEVSGLRVEKCSFMSSKKTPLWLVLDSVQHEKAVVSIFKSGDDLRQDMLTLQLLRVFDRIWLASGLDLRLSPYRVIATGTNAQGEGVGMIEVVLNAKTTSDIQLEHGGGAIGALKSSTLTKYLMACNKSPDRFARAVQNFVRSCAAYCVATFVLGIGDRHNGNIMLSRDGHLFHIDFGHFLGNFKSKMGWNRERSAFVFTPEMAAVMGGKRGDNYKQFKELSLTAFNVLRKHARLFITLFQLMVPAGMPELQRCQDIAYLRDRLCLDKSDDEARKTFKAELRKALSNTYRRVDNLIHNAKHG
ncbi:MAG: hypothetical protein MHM6MM_002418 [Cercozoa sp. M6MM]